MRDQTPATGGLVMTPDMLTTVPNQPKTPQRTVRVPDDEWDAAKAAAERQGETVTDVIRRALRSYAKRHKP